jgi:hypothetical protein
MEKLPGDVLPSTQFQLVSVKDVKKTPNVRYGIVVAGDNLGKVVPYMPPPKGISAEAARLTYDEKKGRFENKKQELQVERENEEDMLAIPVLMKAIRAAGKAPLNLDELQLVAEECLHRFGHDTIKRYCDGMLGKDAASKSKIHGGRDYESAVEKHMQTVVQDTASLALWLLEVSLYMHVGGTRKKTEWSKGNPIYRIAKDRNVSFEEAWAPLKEKYDVRQARAAKRLGLEVGKGGKPKPPATSENQPSKEGKGKKTKPTRTAKQPAKTTQSKTEKGGRK